MGYTMRPKTKPLYCTEANTFFKKLERQNLQFFKIYAQNISRTTNVHMVYKVSIALSRKCALEISFAYKIP